MRATLDPASFPAERQLELLDGYLKGRAFMPPRQSHGARPDPA